MRQDKLLVQMTTAFTHADVDTTKKLVPQLMRMAYEGGNSYEDMADKILLVQAAWGAVHRFEASSLEKAHVYSYTLGVFYWNDGIKPYLLSLLPEQLQGCAHLGMHLSECSSKSLPDMMQHPTKDLFAKSDVDFLGEGEQQAKLQALLLLVKETNFLPDELLEENTWLQVMGAYSANKAALPTYSSSLYMYMSDWFPQYEFYLKHCAAMEMTPAEVITLMPTVTQSIQVSMPLEIA